MHEWSVRTGVIARAGLVDSLPSAYLIQNRDPIVFAANAGKPEDRWAQSV
jgi:hypothetical protein